MWSVITTCNAEANSSRENTVNCLPQALVSCLELLEDENMDTRVCGCKALACLKVKTHTVCQTYKSGKKKSAELLTDVFDLLSLQAKESIDQLVYLCRTDKEEVRDAAKQALLMLGKNNNHVLDLQLQEAESRVVIICTPNIMKDCGVWLFIFFL